MYCAAVVLMHPFSLSLSEDVSMLTSGSRQRLLQHVDKHHFLSSLDALVDFRHLIQI